MLKIIFSFIIDLLTGKVTAIWQAHKEQEARNDEAKIDTLSDKQLNIKFDSDLVRPKD